MLCGSWRRALAASSRSGYVTAMRKRSSIDSYFQRLPDTTKKQLTTAAAVGKGPATASDPGAPTPIQDTVPAADAARHTAAGSAQPSYVVAAAAAAAGGGGRNSPARAPRPRSPVRKPAPPWKKSPQQQQQQQQQHSPPPTGADAPAAPGDTAAAAPAAQSANPPPAEGGAAAGPGAEAGAMSQPAGEAAAGADKTASTSSKGPSAMQRLMAGAKAQAKAQPSAAAAADAPPQLTPEEMAQQAASNQAAVSAALAAAAAAGRPPSLKELLVEPSWVEVLGGEFDKPYMASLQTFLEGEWAREKAGQQVFPPQESVFRAFNSVPFDQVRVVILGQDPYHQPGNAMGLSFSVPPGKRPPQSLINMYKELADNCGVPPSSSGDLTPWCRQGVLLLNAMLTVREAAASSHARKGWEAFTDAAIAALSARRQGVVFLLWGNFAITKGGRVDKAKHHVLTAAHPSPLAASRGFFGCKHFSKANQLLQESGQRAIDWRIS